MAVMATLGLLTCGARSSGESLCRSPPSALAVAWPEPPDVLFQDLADIPLFL
jgi:hypothetical protein